MLTSPAYRRGGLPRLSGIPCFEGGFPLRCLQRMNAGARMAFLEDKTILEAVQKGMAEMETPNIDLGLDAGAKLFRLKLQRLIDEENSN